MEDLDVERFLPSIAEVSEITDSESLDDLYTLAEEEESNLNLTGGSFTPEETFEEEEEEEMMIVGVEEVDVAEGFFDWRVTDEISDSLIREYEPNSVILAANVVNDCLFRLLDGTAHLEQLDLRLQDHQLKRYKSDNQEQVQWQDLFKESEQPIAWQELFQSKNSEESPIHEPVPEKEKEKEEESEDETTLDDQTLGGFGEMEDEIQNELLLANVVIIPKDKEMTPKRNDHQLGREKGNEKKLPSHNSLYNLGANIRRAQSESFSGVLLSPTGIPSGPKRSKFGSIRCHSEWPIFGELSTLNPHKSDKLTTMSIVASTKCRVQIISRASLCSFLFSDPREYKRANLFFETMCRYYTSKLKGVHQRKLSQKGKKIPRQGGCVTINGEVILFSSKVIVKKHSVRLMAISKSYVALLAPKERGKGFQVDRSDGNQTNILELANVEKVEVHEKKKFFRILGKDGSSLDFKWKKNQMEPLKQALGLSGVELDVVKKSKHQKEGLKPSTSTSIIYEFPNGELDFGKAISGLNENDIEKLRTHSKEEFYESGEVICVQGVRFYDILYVLEGNYVITIKGIEEKKFVLDQTFIGEVSYILDCAPTATIAGGENGCRLLRIPYSSLVVLSREDNFFMCRLYQSFLFQIWGRITDHDKRQLDDFQKVAPKEKSKQKGKHPKEEKIDENWGIKQAAPLSIVLQNPLVSDLHQLFLETSEKGFQLPIEMVQSFVDNCISTSEIYTFLFALIQFYESHEMLAPLILTLMKAAIDNKESELPLFSDSGITRIICVFIVEQCGEWLKECLFEALHIITGSPDKAIEEEEIDNLIPTILRNMPKYSRAIPPETIQLLGWIEDYAKSVDSSLGVPVMGNLLLLRGIVRMLLHPAHLLIAIDDWTNEQRESVLRLAERLATISQIENRDPKTLEWRKLFKNFLACLSDLWSECTVSGTDLSFGETSCRVKITKRVDSCLRNFRMICESHAHLFWNYPAIKELLIKMTQMALNEISFQVDWEDQVEEATEYSDLGVLSRKLSIF